MKINLDTFGGRRFLFSIFLALLSFKALQDSQLKSSDFVDLLKMLTLVYVGGNIGQRGIEAYRDVKKAPEQQASEVNQAASPAQNQ